MPIHDVPLVVALHGATGTQGAPVARRLLRDGHRVRAVARRPEHSPAGCEPFAADLLDADALARAYAGADAVVIQLPLVFDDRAVLQARCVAEALRRSGVRRVVFNTSAPAPPRPVGVPNLDARAALIRALEDGPSRVTVLQPVAPYMENLAAPWSAPLVRQGILAYPLPAEAPVPWLALDDVAGHIAAALAGDEDDRPLICGPRALTGAEAADALARGLGRPVRWVTMTPAAYGDLLRPHLGDAIAGAIAGLYEAQAQAPPRAPDPALLRAGRIDLESWARARACDETGTLAMLTPAA